MKCKMCKIITGLLASLMLISPFAAVADDITFTYDGESNLSRGGGTITDKGFSIIYIKNEIYKDVGGFRFSLYNEDGSIKDESNPYDIMLSEYETQSGTDNVAALISAGQIWHSSAMLTKKKINEDISGGAGFNVSLSSNFNPTKYELQSSGSYSGFLSCIPQNPADMEGWIMAENSENTKQNIVCMSLKCGVNPLTGLLPTDKIVVEPLIRCRLGISSGSAQSTYGSEGSICYVTPTELAMLGAYFYGPQSRCRGISGAVEGTMSWLCNYVCNYFPNMLYAPNETVLFGSINSVDPSQLTCEQVMQYAYGAAVVGLERANIVINNEDYYYNITANDIKYYTNALCTHERTSFEEGVTYWPKYSFTLNEPTDSKNWGLGNYVRAKLNAKNIYTNKTESWENVRFLEHETVTKIGEPFVYRANYLISADNVLSSEMNTDTFNASSYTTNTSDTTDGKGKLAFFASSGQLSGVMGIGGNNDIYVKTLRYYNSPDCRLITPYQATIESGKEYVFNMRVKSSDTNVLTCLNTIYFKQGGPASPLEMYAGNRGNWSNQTISAALTSYTQDGDYYNLVYDFTPSALTDLYNLSFSFTPGVTKTYNIDNMSLCCKNASRITSLTDLSGCSASYSITDSTAVLSLYAPQAYSSCNTETKFALKKGQTYTFSCEGQNAALSSSYIYMMDNSGGIVFISDIAKSKVINASTYNVTFDAPDSKEYRIHFIFASTGVIKLLNPTMSYAQTYQMGDEYKNTIISWVSDMSATLTNPERYTAGHVEDINIEDNMIYDTQRIYKKVPVINNSTMVSTTNKLATLHSVNAVSSVTGTVTAENQNQLKSMENTCNNGGYVYSGQTLYPSTQYSNESSFSSKFHLSQDIEIDRYAGSVSKYNNYKRNENINSLASVTINKSNGNYGFRIGVPMDGTMDNVAGKITLMNKINYINTGSADYTLSSIYNTLNKSSSIFPTNLAASTIELYNADTNNIITGTVDGGTRVYLKSTYRNDTSLPVYARIIIMNNNNDSGNIDVTGYMNRGEILTVTSSVFEIKTNSDIDNIYYNADKEDYSYYLSNPETSVRFKAKALILLGNENIGETGIENYRVSSGFTAYETNVRDNVVFLETDVDNDGDTDEGVIIKDPLKIQFVTPNSFYRRGTEVISSFDITNNTNTDINTSDAVAGLTIGYNNGGNFMQCLITEINFMSAPYVIPAKSTTRIWYKWTVSDTFDDINDIILRVDGDINRKYSEKFTNISNYQAEWTLSDNVKCQTPDTAYTPDTPSWYNDTASVNTVKSYFADPYNYLMDGGIKLSTSWRYWTINNGVFEHNTDTASLNMLDDNFESVIQITPAGAPSAYHNSDGEWVIKSGYGYEMNANLITTGKRVSCTPVQNVCCLLPEFNYRLCTDTIQDIASDRSSFVTADNYIKDNAVQRMGFKQIDSYVDTYNNGVYGTFVSLSNTDYNTFELPVNGDLLVKCKNMQYANNMHFIPIWYPDTDYTVKCYVYDYWTPDGMISGYINSNTIWIEGNMFDDYYIEER